MIDKRDLRKYNPYVYLALENGFNEEEVMYYYNGFKKMYGNGRAFKKRIINANDEAIDIVIGEFLASRESDAVALDILREEVNKIKKIVFMTEKENKTDQHISRIDYKVGKAIDYRISFTNIEDVQGQRLYMLLNKFNNSDDIDNAEIILRDSVNELILEYEDFYSLMKAKRVRDYVIGKMNSVINARKRDASKSNSEKIRGLKKR